MAADDEEGGVTGRLVSEDLADERKVPDSQEIARRIQSELKLVAIIAAQVSRTVDNCVDFDELLSAGREGLLDASRRFDPSRGVPFRVYANYRIEGAIIDWVRKSMQLSRRVQERLTALEAFSRIAQGDADYALNEDNAAFWERDADQYIVDQLAMISTSAAALESCPKELDSTAEEEIDANPEDAYERAELASLIREALAVLDEQETQIIRLCYFEGMSFGTMAKTMNITKSWAHCLHARAMNRLTKRLRNASA